MGLFGKKEPKPPERVEMPTRFGMGFGFGNQMMQWGNQQMADATQMLANMNATDGMRRRVGATGLPGTATIKAFRDTGGRSNLNPVYELDLHVEVDGLSPYDMTRISEVNVIAVPELVPGARVPVKVDATDPSQLLIGWMNGTAWA